MAAFLVGILNLIIKALGAVLTLIFGLLPPSPFSLIDNSPVSEYLPALNYFIPIAEIITISELWLIAVGTYYIYQIVLRWVKAIE